MQLSSILRQCLLAGAVAFGASLPAQEAAAILKLTPAEQETFLRGAKIGTVRSVPVGIANTRRATLSDGKVTHDAHIQTIDEAKAQFRSAVSTEVNFKDTYKYNIAGYKLDQMLGLNMVPVSVERKVGGTSAAVTWWIDDVRMDEGKRLKKNIQPPDRDDWNNQMYIVRVFDQLIHNMDRNVGNLVISSDWKIWMIDHTRAFRTMRTLKDPKNLIKCEREFLARMKQLNEDDLTREMKGYLTKEEIKGLLARRDLIVKHFETAGESALYSYPRRAS